MVVINQKKKKCGVFLHGWVVTEVLVGSGTVAEELRAAVGQRLAGGSGEAASRSILNGDAEDSPLQESQRSSMFISLCCSLLLSFVCFFLLTIKACILLLLLENAKLVFIC